MVVKFEMKELETLYGTSKSIATLIWQVGFNTNTQELIDTGNILLAASDMEAYLEGLDAIGENGIMSVNHVKDEYVEIWMNPEYVCDMYNTCTTVMEKMSDIYINNTSLLNSVIKAIIKHIKKSINKISPIIDRYRFDKTTGSDVLTPILDELSDSINAKMIEPFMDKWEDKI